MPPVIEMRGLRRTYGRQKALDGLNLTVQEGRILGLVGPNGAGKSTALSAMLGLIPCHGELRVLGRDPWRDRERVMLDVAFIADVALAQSVAGARLYQRRASAFRPRQGWTVSFEDERRAPPQSA